MGAVMMLAGTELRRRWRSIVVLTLLVGVAGAVVLALVAGARRTSSSLARFESYSQSADLEVTVGHPTPAQLREFVRSPGVKTVGRVYEFALLEQHTQQFFAVAAQMDGTFGTKVDRPVVLQGRLADQQSPDEVVVGEALAQQLHLGLGDRLHFDSYTLEQIRRGLLGDPLLTADGPKISLRVVGVVRRPLDLGGRGAAGGVIVPTQAFLAKYRYQLGSFVGTILRVRTDRGAADLARVTKAARRVFGRAPEFEVLGLAIEGQGAQNAIDVTTVALEIAAGIAALVALVGVSLALSREVSLVDVDQLTLRALGMRSSRRALAAAAVALPVAVLGALVAAGASALASPLFPIGIARKAEVDSGIRFDPLVVFGGFLVVTLAVLAVGAASGWRTARVTRRTRPERRVFGARASGALALPPTATIGVGFALDRGRGARAVPVRSSLIGAALGVIVLVAVAVFGTSLDHLVSTPSAYGTTWQFAASDSRATSTKVNCDKVQTRLTRLRSIAAVTSICTLGMDVDGHPVSGWGFTDLRGHIGPALVRGRAPATPNEVALGADTLAAIHKDIGDSVRVRGERGPFRYRVVGQTLLSRLDVGDPEPLADGAVFTGAGAARVDEAGSQDSSWTTVVRFAPGVSAKTARARLDTVARRDTPPQGASVPAEIDRIRQIDALPVALAAFVAVVALAAVGFALVTAVRRRQRDLAVLKTLGFRRRQVRATVAWHATTVAAIALLVGIPFGLVAGRFVWRAVADELGISADPTWPVLAITLLVPAAVLAVNVVAAVPARRAARTRPAVVLRSE